MAEHEILLSELRARLPELHAGDTVSLTGTLYTARDAAHKRLIALLDQGLPLPADLRNAVIYYAGPTPAHDDLIIGSCGPTTSGRMDVFAPRLIEHGLAGMIGKGDRRPPVIETMKRFGAVYFAAIGGAGAVIADCVKSLEVIAFEELGCESMKRLEVKGFPAIVAIDTYGSNLYQTGRTAFIRHETV